MALRDRTVAVSSLLVSILLTLSHGMPSSSPPSSPPPHTVPGRPEISKTLASSSSSSSSSKQPTSPSPPSSGQDDEKDDNDDAALLADFLWQYGYFRTLGGQQQEFPPSPGHRAERDARSEAIRRLQSFFGLDQTGQPDAATMKLVTGKRCGVADIPIEPDNYVTAHDVKARDVASHTQTPSDYTLLGTKWKKSQLTWKLHTPSNQLSREEQRYTMEEAFAMWQAIAPLDFTEKGPHDDVDIVIKFGAKQHGDQYPFDGRGKVLAHAFGPGETAISGDMHVDNEERWSPANGQQANDLLIVATHELGHSLGLSHSRDPKALMFPYYGLTDKLGQDDIKAIQYLYGARIGPPPPTRRPSRRRGTTTAPLSSFPWAKSATYTDRPPQHNTPRPGCDLQFDVVIQDDVSNRDVYTGIQEDVVYRFNQAGLVDGYPTTLQALYPGAPSGAQAVFTVPETSATYFIKGDQVWRYLGGESDPDFPKTLTLDHFPETIRFVLPLVDANGIQRIFVFGRTYWLEYSFDRLPSTKPQAHLIPYVWPAVASDVRYAVRDYDDNINLISPGSYVVLDSFRRAMYGGKQDGVPHWLQAACHLSAPSGGMSASLHSLGPASVAMAISTLLLVHRN